MLCQRRVRQGRKSKAKQSVLKSGGFFLFDVFSETVYGRKTENVTRAEYPDGGFWYPGAHVVNEGLFLYPEERASATYYIVEADGEDREYLVWDTCYSPERLSTELASCGFSCREIYCNVCGADYSGERVIQSACQKSGCGHFFEKEERRLRTAQIRLVALFPDGANPPGRVAPGRRICKDISRFKARKPRPAGKAGGYE